MRLALPLAITPLQSCGMLLAASVWLLSGCAFIDQKLSLRYTPQGAPAPLGVTERVLLTTIDLEASMQRKENSVIIGNVKNGYGVKTADAVTESKVDEWILGELAADLQRRGFLVRRVEAFPAEYDAGARVILRRLWVEQDPGFWTVGAITDLSFALELYSKGHLVRKVIVSAKGDSRSMMGLSTQKEESLEKALRAAMEQASNEIVSAFKQ